jgi:hypothetical protein
VPGGTVTLSGGAPPDAGGGTSGGGVTGTTSTSATSATSGDFGASSPGLGLGVFSRFPVSISLSVHGGYDDNFDTLPGGQKQGSWFTETGLVVAYKSITPRTQLNLSSNVGFTYYGSADTNPFEPNLNLTIDLTHKVSPRLQLAMQSNTVYQREPDFQYGLGTNRRSGNYFYTTDRLSGSYTWLPRFSTATNYVFTAVKYDDIASGLFEDRIENTIGNEFRFLIWPTTNMVFEYRFEAVSYQHEGEMVPGTALTLQRDSTTHYLLGGFDHAFSSRLTADVRGGVELREYDTIGERNSPYFEATVNYVLGKDTSVAWNTHYGIEEGDIALNPTRKTFRTGIQGKHNLTARISASLSLYFDHDNYNETEVPLATTPPSVQINPAFSEDSFNLNLAIRYAMTRYMGIETGYDFSDVSSGQAGRDYTRNRVWGGINVAF